MKDKKFLLTRSYILLLLTTLFQISCQPSESKTSESQKSEVVNTDLKKSITCFVYHRFGNEKYPSTNIDLQTFEQHLTYLKEHDFMVLTLREAVDYLKDETPSQKVAVLTVDDGYKTFKTGALPLLKKYDFKATLFVNTETVGGSSYLNWDDLKEISNSGIEIGNHTHSHAYFLNYEEAIRYKNFESDVMKAQNLFQKHLNVKPVTFAYPYGEYDEAMKKTVKEIGFEAAVAQNSGVMNSQADFYAIPRFPMASSYAELKNFTEKVNMQTIFLSDANNAEHVVSDNPPKMSLSFDKANYQLKNLQCFIQGGSCDLNVNDQDSIVTVSIKSKSSLKRRRTLYTITVPDQDGKWHWISHLWVIPSIKE